MTKRWLIPMCFVVLAVSTALAQQKDNVPSPPKPGDEGPSLEATMTFIQEKVRAKGKRAKGGSYNNADALAGAEADPATCQLSLVNHARNGLDYVDQLSLREVEKIDVTGTSDGSYLTTILMTSQTAIKTYMPSTSLKPLKKRKLGKPERPKGETSIWFDDEDLANRVAQAMVHATDLCGGGSKPEPF